MAVVKDPKEYDVYFAKETDEHLAALLYTMWISDTATEPENIPDDVKANWCRVARYVFYRENDLVQRITQGSDREIAERRVMKRLERWSKEGKTENESLSRRAFGSHFPEGSSSLESEKPGSSFQATNRGSSLFGGVPESSKTLPRAGASSEVGSRKRPSSYDSVPGPQDKKDDHLQT